MRTIIKAEIRNDTIIWITAQRVTELTDWHYSDLEVFREEGNVTVKKVGKQGYRYDLDSVYHLFEKIKKFKTA